MRLSDGVHSFDLDWPDHAEPLSVHVVETDQATVLFGAGDERTARRVVDVATRFDVDVVVAEHGDPDHYRGMPALREALDVTTAVPVGDADRVRADGIEPDRELHPGETYWGVETIGVPGHTPGNLAFLYRDVLVAGDTVAGSDSAYAAPDPWTGPLAVTLPESAHDDAAMRANVALLREHGFDAVLVTHGSNVRSGGRAAVETLCADLDECDDDGSTTADRTDG